MQRMLLSLAFLAPLLACVGDAPTTPADAASDAPADVATTTDAGDGGSGFCDGQGTAVLCEDFDHGDLTARGWSPDPTNSNPPPTTAGSPTKSPPKSLHSVTADDGASGLWTKLVKSVNVGGALTKSTLEADVLVDTATFKTNGNFVALGFSLSTGPLPVALRVNGTNWTCIGLNKTADSVVAFPLKSWVHVTLLAQKTGTTSYDVTCTVDGTSVVVTGGDGTGATADRRIPIGHNTTQMKAVEQYLDNVVLRAE